ncbi:ribose 5-phosphate isomerase A [Paenibacillus camerounensis]|uniref:ribose 5-phosphate isomerase A n=1 Tax=Paenibacillus camerounensis TaxID=1243663 RepID=UPI001FCB5EC7|nr:ribose 5-phosphate isomerase A [Paenibacillus camerounensis]
MDKEQLRMKAAQEAISYIQENTVIGLGGGSTIACLIKLLHECGRCIEVVTPSAATAALCIRYGLPLLPLGSVERISVAFDGCDEVDHQFRALKSGGGIHTREKLVAGMADHYILLADESKLVERLTFKHPVVLEILHEALGYVQRSVTSLGGSSTVRTSPAKDGYTISDNGHLLLDVLFTEPDRLEIEILQDNLKKINGVIETSLFTMEVSGVIVAGEHGVRTIFRETYGKIY